MLESLFGKEETPTQVFLCEFCNFLGTSSFIEDFQWLFLDLIFAIFQIQILILADPCLSITLHVFFIRKFFIRT